MIDTLKYPDAVNPDFQQVVQKIAPDSKLLRTWQLKGSVSAQVIVLETEQADGRTKKMVIRQHGDGDLQQNPQVAAGEFKLLQRLQSLGLPVPAPYYLDQSGELLSTPYIVIEYMEGKPEFAPADLTGLILQMVAYLGKIHQIKGADTDLSFLPLQEKIVAEKLANRPVNLDETLLEGPIRDTLEAVWPWPQSNGSVLLHGDFWPGNLLWKDGRLVAILDWEDAALGDPLADVANSRLEILWAFGRDAMHHFTQHYQSLAMIDFANLPYWELWAALRPASKLSTWGLDNSTEKAMREGHRVFVEQAFAKISTY
jgi:aminoglycoside phosphotransferase (APT) family kinase protein